MSPLNGLAKIAAEGRAGITQSKIQWLLGRAYPFRGDRPIHEIKATDVLAALYSVEAHGKHESVRRIAMNAAGFSLRHRHRPLRA